MNILNVLNLNKKNIYRINISKTVIILTILAIVLNIFRVIIWGKESFLYILWNIFLAFVPFIISSFLLTYCSKINFNKLIFIVGIILWILFIPNAPYIITDFIHLGEIRAIPIIYDILLIFTSASVGLILGFGSLLHIEQIIKLKYSARIASIIISFIIIMISFGVYVGRFLRFNSWDVFINHTSLFKNVWKIFSGPTVNTEVYFYTILFSFFLLLTYSAWKSSNTNIK